LSVKGANQPRNILHLDLDPFFVSVERRIDPALKGRPLIVGGAGGAAGVVAAASSEARASGVRAGQLLATARRLCPAAEVRPGDLENYARVSEEVGAVLATHSRRFERPSADEAYVDVTPDAPRHPAPVHVAEAIKDEIQKRLGIDVALGLSASRIGARVASTWARPRGLLVVLPGYERSFIARAPLSLMPDLPPQLVDRLAEAGFETLGQVAEAAAGTIEQVLGVTAGTRLRSAVVGDGEDAIEIAAPPAWLQEEVRVRDRQASREDLLSLLEGLTVRACRRVRAFGVQAGNVTVEVERGDTSARRSASLQPGLRDDETATRVVQGLAAPLLDPAPGVRSLQLRLGRFARPSGEARLFPGMAGGALL
jgi:DNA polymerase-4